MDYDDYDDIWNQDEEVVDIRNKMANMFANKEDWEKWIKTPDGTIHILQNVAWAEWWEDGVNRIIERIKAAPRLATAKRTPYLPI